MRKMPRPEALPEVISTGEFNQILTEIANPEVNQDAIKLEVAPKVAVYTPNLIYKRGTYSTMG